ncbi:MAG TPA: glycosyltransferase family 39 protein [Thermoanaerobaculia bacterium]|nr:glycosyltransferase family 39 protein [Thermoanaerobaculia bacterium]
MGTGLEDAITLPARRRLLAALAALAAVLAVAAMLRFESLGQPSFWLDEILGYDLTTAATARPWWAWLAGFDAEHGPLYYATQLIGRVVSDPETAARWVPALLGTATILLVWMAGTALGAGATAGLCAAVLLAASPLHVYYSREGRPYALAMLLAAAMLVALLRGSRWFYPLVAAALYTSAVAAPLIAAAAVAAIGSALLQADPVARRRGLAAGGAALAALGAVPLLYRGAGGSSSTLPFPELDAAFLDTLVRAFGVSAIGSEERGRTAVAILVLAVAGAVSLLARDRRRGVIVVSMAVLPVVVALAALRLTDHWYAVRYLSPALPAYIVLAAAGISAAARAVSERLRRPAAVEWAVALAAAGAIVAQTIPGARYEPHQKLDWRLIASTLWHHAGEGDLVIAAEGWSNVSLGFYLRSLPPRVRLFEVGRPEIAEALLSENGRAWLVTAGYSGPSRVAEWICRFPVVLSSRLEGFRMHYAPGPADFLRARSTIHERRAVAAASGSNSLTLSMGREDGIFLDSSWADAEGTGEDTFRWVVGREATVTLPLTGRKDRVLTMRASPLSHRGLPPQVMHVSLNGTAAGEITMPAGLDDYELRLPATAWRPDGANVLEIRFSRAHAPADLDPSLSDPRPLSAAFHMIRAGDAGAPASPAPSPPFRAIRLQELTPAGPAPYLDALTARRREKTKLTRLDRDAVEPLLGRLGFDPVVAWPRLAAGETAIEHLLESLATSSACEDDRAFIRRAWLALFERAPNPIEQRVLLSLLRSEGSRMALISRIARMDETRAAFTAATSTTGGAAPGSAAADP